GDSYLALGRLAEAETQFQAVEQTVRHPRPQDRWMLWRYAQHLFHSYGSLLLERGDLTAALAFADECLLGATATDSPKNIVKALRLRGQTLVARGELALAAIELKKALELARRLGNPTQLYRTLAAVGDLRRAQWDQSAGRRTYRRALAVIDGVAAELADPS